MKKSMKHKKYLKFEDYDFSDCREINGDELYRINGGGRIQPEQNENPPEGDSSNNSDSYTVQSGDTLSQIVYDYNQANGTHLTVDEVAALSGIENPDLILPGQDIIFGNNDTSGQTTDPTNPTGSTSTSSNPSSTSSGNSSANSGTTVPDFADPFAPVSNGNFGVDNENQIISADINNPQSVIDAYNSYYIWGDRGYKFQLKDGDNEKELFTNEKDVIIYLQRLDNKNNSKSDNKKKTSRIENLIDGVLNYLYIGGTIYNDVSIKMTSWNYENRYSKNNISEFDNDKDAYNYLSGVKNTDKVENGWREEKRASCHQNGDGYYDEKYCNIDGREIIFDGKSIMEGNPKIDRNSLTEGSFNYCDPGIKPSSSNGRNNLAGWAEYIGRGVGHGLFDLLPWYILGSSRIEEVSFQATWDRVKSSLQ